MLILLINFGHTRN